MVFEAAQIYTCELRHYSYDEINTQKIYDIALYIVCVQYSNVKPKVCHNSVWYVCLAANYADNWQNILVLLPALV